MCQGGNSRSVALAYLFKSLGYEAIAIGYGHTTLETKKLLFNWADVICVMQYSMKREVPPEYHSKTFVFDVGEDRYFLGYKQELLDILKRYINTIPWKSK